MAERESLAALKEFVPVDEVVFEGNLRPILEERVRTERRPWRLRAAFSVLCGAMIVATLNFALSTPSSDKSGDMIATESASDRYFVSILGRADQLMTEEKFPKAYILLHDSIEEKQDEGAPLEARVLLAELAYEQLKWYPEAYEAYAQLRLAYPEAYQNSDESIRRYALLDEAHAFDTEFASLHEWNRVVGEGDILALGSYIQSYPGTLKASDAVQEMARLISVDRNDSEMALDAVLEVALLSSDDPVVAAQIKLELGRYYWRNTDNSEKARALFEEVEDSPVTVLARAASQSLLALKSE